jgi:hypothetical protein
MHYFDTGKNAKKEIVDEKEWFSQESALMIFWSTL